jgi:uncharacterized RDD family membrane protein YckC
MTQENILKLAKQGNPKALAVMLNQSLQPKGIAAQVSRKDDCLQILLESAQIPDQKAMVSYIRNGLIKLEVESIKTVKVYGRPTGEESSVWNKKFEIVSQQETPSNTEQTDFNNLLSHQTLHKTPRAVPPEGETHSITIQTSHQTLHPFNRVTLQTPESVELEFTLAGIGSRGYALLIDFIILGLILKGFLIAWAFLSIQLLDVIENFIGSNSKLGLWLLAIQSLISFFIDVGYFVFFETLWQGQTPGKRFAKIRVIRDDGRPIRLQQSTLRALLLLVDGTFFIGVFLIALTKREKRLGDLVAGTLVIQEEQPIASATFRVSDQAQALADQLQTEADLSRLLPEDFAVIREYLRRRQAMTPQAKAELSRKLAHQVKEVIALANVPQKVTADLFLEAVYLAYQQQSSA